MTAIEIAETLLNGNISDARAAIVQGQTQQSAAVLTVDVIASLARLDDNPDRGERWFAAAAKVRRCLTGGS
jgi:hypothetical protein